jgi:hypothetical protein
MTIKNISGAMVYDTVNGFRAQIYGIVRTGFANELDAWRWIANVCGVSVASVMSASQNKKNNFGEKKRCRCLIECKAEQSRADRNCP